MDIEITESDLTEKKSSSILILLWSKPKKLKTHWQKKLVFLVSLKKERGIGGKGALIRGGRLFDIMALGLGTYLEEGAY